MVSVTARSTQVKQPRGGYVKPSTFESRTLVDGNPGAIDQKIENLHASLVGLAVDYLARLANGDHPSKVFYVSIYGARRIGGDALAHAEALCASLAPGVVDDRAIDAASQLAGFDVAARQGLRFYNPDAVTLPDDETRKHIALMVERSRAFFDEYGPVVAQGLTFNGGYTSTVDTGDADFLTQDTLWDFKVSVSKPTPKNTLQLLMYYLMGSRSFDHELDFINLSHLGFFNPRLNLVSRLEIASIPAEVIAEVSRDVIGFD